MSRTQFNELGSCEVRRLTQLSSTDFTWTSKAFFTPGLSWITPEDRRWVKRRSSHESIQTHNQRSEGSILTLPWEPLTNKIACVICLVWQFGSTELSSTFNSSRRSFNYSSRPKLSLGSAHVKCGFDSDLRKLNLIRFLTYLRTTEPPTIKSNFRRDSILFWTTVLN